MRKADPAFKERLSTVEEAGKPGYCYQCSACVAECPSVSQCEGFNPREIVLASLLDAAGYLTDRDSVVWRCTTCYKCNERGPRGRHPVEVVTALKNIAYDLGNAPDDVVALRETVKKNGTLGDKGYQVYMVEEEPSIGVRMALLDKMFPSNDCSMCTIAPKMVACFNHRNIEVLTCSEVEEVKGKVGRLQGKVETPVLVRE